MEADSVDLRQILTQTSLNLECLEVLFKLDIAIQGFAVTSRDAFAFWRDCRRLLNGSGWYPLIVGDQESLERLEEEWSEGHSDFAQIVTEGMSLDPRSTLQRLGEDLWDDTPLGRWSSKVLPRTELVVPHQSQAGEPMSMTHLAFLPVDQGWQVPAALGLGGWNYCPGPPEHVAVLKYWYEHWGAQPVAARYDTLELQVMSLPEGREEALKLAREHLSYCGDVLWEQQPSTLRSLASRLLHSSIWYFWWD